MPEGKRIDFIGPVTVGEPFDVGWGIAVFNEDHTCTRTCKGCGVRVTTRVQANGKVEQAGIHHLDNCPVMLGNNPATS